MVFISVISSSPAFRSISTSCKISSRWLLMGLSTSPSKMLLVRHTATYITGPVKVMGDLLSHRIGKPSNLL